MAVKVDQIDFTINALLDQVARKLNLALSKAKAGLVEELQSEGPLGRFDERADVEIAAQGNTVTSMWRVEIYLSAGGDKTYVTMAATGDGGFTRAMAGMRNSYSLSTGIKKRDEIAAALR